MQVRMCSVSTLPMDFQSGSQKQSDTLKKNLVKKQRLAPGMWLTRRVFFTWSIPGQILLKLGLAVDLYVLLANRKELGVDRQQLLLKWYMHAMNISMKQVFIYHFVVMGELSMIIIW